MSDIEIELDELDLPPEYCRYHDEGCELAASCLSCPLPRCVYDQPRGRQRWLKRARDREIVKRFTTAGSGVKELALEFGVSQRTVQRALKKTLINGGLPRNE
jgi:DNA-binding transcriptional ArsR family regulator